MDLCFDVSKDFGHALEFSSELNRPFTKTVLTFQFMFKHDTRNDISDYKLFLEYVSHL